MPTRPARGIIPEIVFSGRSGLGLTSDRKSGERGGWKTQLPAFTASSSRRFLNDCAKRLERDYLISERYQFSKARVTMVFVQQRNSSILDSFRSTERRGAVLAG